MIVVVADESELEGAEQIVGAALRDQAFRAGGIAVFRCHVPENRGGSVEVDALVCTPQSVTIVEVKGFTARQEGTLATPPNGPWTIDGEPAALYHAARVPNPFVQVRRQVFAAKSLLQQSGIFGWVNAVITLVPQPGAEITIEETRIADGYRAVLVDRDDASALHDYFQAESGRTVRLSIDDVTRVFAALNLGHLLPRPDALTAQGFPAALDPATTARPAAPTAVDLDTAPGTANSATRTASTGSSVAKAAAPPAFLAAIDRLAHRTSPSARPEETTPSPAAETAQSPSPRSVSRGTGDNDAEADTPATALDESVPDRAYSDSDVAAEVSPSVASAEPLARVAAERRESTENSATDGPSPSDAFAAEQADEPAADDTTPVGLSSSDPAGQPAERGLHETQAAPRREIATAAAAVSEHDTDEQSRADLGTGQSPKAGNEAAQSPASPESAVSLHKSSAGIEPGTISTASADGRGDEVEATTSTGSSASHHERPPEDDDSSRGAPPDAGGTAAGTGTMISTAAAFGAAAAAGSTRSPDPAQNQSWSSPAAPPSHRPSESNVPQASSERWSDWVEHDQTTRRPTPAQRWRAWRQGSGGSLIERWHNRPVRERHSPRLGLRVGPGVALLLFIALFGAGFFAITAVQASRFEMSDYDRMCGEDKKPFPNAAPYQRDGARPIYLSGDLTTMVEPGDPTAWNPRDPSTVQLIACVRQLELRDLVQTCQYGPSPDAPIGRTVNLFRATYEVAVYELHTGREVAKATMLGERYSTDPSNTDPDRCRAAADAPDYLGRRLGQPSTAQLTGFLAPLVHADRTTP